MEMKCNLLPSWKNVKLHISKERPENYLDIRSFKKLTNAGYCVTTICVSHTVYLLCIAE